MASPQATPLATARLFGLIGWLGYVPGDSKPPVSPPNSPQGRRLSQFGKQKKKGTQSQLRTLFGVLRDPGALLRGGFEYSCKLVT